MEGRDQNAALAHQHSFAFGRSENFHARPRALDDRGANEDHFDGGWRKGCNLVTHFARELATVSVARDGYVGKPEGGLRGVADFLRQQDGPSARAEDSPATRGMLTQTLVETLFDKELPLGRAFSAGQDYGVHAIKIAWRAHKHMLDPHSRQHRAMRVKIALYCEDSDFQEFPCLPNILSIRENLVNCHSKPRQGPG